MIPARSTAPWTEFDSWEPLIHSFVTLCDVSTTGRGPLSGVTVGVKDIIDVAGVPTRNGSATSADVEPARADATVVAALRAAGARIMGKTVTTEFAFTDPTECRNPHDLTRTPGGSSSGSGAAVAAGLVDVALGTQTAGSLCRPAAYCGVVGFKPGYGVLPRDGVTPLARSFDSVGIIARSVDLATASFGAMTSDAEPRPTDAPSVVLGTFAGTHVATADTLDGLADAGRSLELTGAHVVSADLQADPDVIVAAHRTVMLAEAAKAHGHLLAPATRALLKPNFRAALEQGCDVTAGQVAAAAQVLSRARTTFWNSLKGVDAVLTLPVPDGAPKLDGTTGFQNWLTLWTIFGGPLLSLPWGTDGLGRPRAVMLAALPGEDMWLLALGAKLEALAPPVPAPRLPA